MDEDLRVKRAQRCLGLQGDAPVTPAETSIAM